MVKSVIKCLIIVLAIVLILGINNNIFATDADGLLFGNDFLLENNTVNDTLTTPNNVPNLVVENVPTLNIPTNNTVSPIPKAGENDIYVVTTLIIISAIVTIYAYKKIRDYSSL